MTTHGYKGAFSLGTAAGIFIAMNPMGQLVSSVDREVFEAMYGDKQYASMPSVASALMCCITNVAKSKYGLLAVW